MLKILPSTLSVNRVIVTLSEQLDKRSVRSANNNFVTAHSEVLILQEDFNKLPLCLAIGLKKQWQFQRNLVPNYIC